MESPNKRVTELMALLSSDCEVEEVAVHVIFSGPVDSLYSGGVWKVRVALPKEFPFKPPSTVFTNKIYHPNVDEVSGLVCPYLTEKDWSPTLDLVYVFEKFLPQLLLNPNLNEPLNKNAAVLMVRDRAAYNGRVREYCERYAKPEDAGIVTEKPSHQEITDYELDSGDESNDSPVDPQPARL